MRSCDRSVKLKAFRPALWSVIALLATGCSTIESVSSYTVEPFRTLGPIASFSLWWLIPATIIFIAFAVDHEETKTASFAVLGKHGYEHGSVEIPTGRTIYGDPNIAFFVAVLWTIIYPIGYLYFPLLTDKSVDLIFGKILAPVAILGAVGWITVWAVKNFYERGWKSVLGIWLAGLGAASFNLVCWLAYLAHLWSKGSL